MNGSRPFDRGIFKSSTLDFFPKVLSVGALLLSLATLSACVETTAAIPPVAELDHRQVAREDANVSAVKLAVMSLSGAPEEIEARFKSAFQTATNKLQLNFVTEKADYFLRGYLTAYPSEDGTVVALVWDAFDAHKKRAQRLSDQLVAPKSVEPGSWTSLKPEDWEKFAELSAANLAAFVSNMPEADKVEQPKLAKSGSKPDETAEVAFSKEAVPSSIDEGRTIAVKSKGEALASAPQMASFH